MKIRHLISLVAAGAIVGVNLLALPVWTQLLMAFLVVYITEGRKPGDQSLAKEPFANRVLRIAPNVGVALLILIASDPFAYGFWAMIYVVTSWLQQVPISQVQQQLARTGANQLLMFWAIFSAAAIWSWHPLAVIGLSWLASFGSTYSLLSEIGERAAKALAAAWALVVAQLAWVFSLWLVNYVYAGGRLIVPQAAIVMTALGYCFGGIYFAHRQNSLSWGRLMEYLLIGLSLMVIVIAGTKWSGTI